MKIKKNKNLKDLNTFKVDSTAQYYSEVTNIQDIQELIQEGVFKKDFYILGGGSNTLFKNHYEGTVIKMNIQGKEILEETDKYVKLKISSGEDWPSIVEWTIKNNWVGAQNLALIPGTAGATPVQNVGAYGSEIKDILEEVEIIDLETGKISTMKKRECKFGYRDSIFKHELKNKVMVLNITLQLEKIDPELEIPLQYLEYKGIQKELESNFSKPYTLQKVFNAVVNIRNDKLPKIEEYGSCGSTFQNPILSRDEYNQLLETYPDIPGYEVGDRIKIPAAYILERLGWKNKRTDDGKCGTWIKHPLIVTNYNDATGKELLELISEIQEDFYKDTGIELKTEINII